MQTKGDESDVATLARRSPPDEHAIGDAVA